MNGLAGKERTGRLGRTCPGRLRPAALIAAAGMLAFAGGCGKGAEEGRTLDAAGTGAGATAEMAGHLSDGSDAKAPSKPADAPVADGLGVTDTEKSNADIRIDKREEREGISYEAAPTDLNFWYEEDSYTSFLELAAARYYEETGVKVMPRQISGSLDYLGEIYDATMENEEFPDLYLLPGECLEEAYLYGLAAENTRSTEADGIVPCALLASQYGGKRLGYPLSYNACVFVFQSDYFGNAPQSLQEIIDYSKENDPAENVEYLLEWDVNDPFYDFPFFSNCVSFEKTEAERMTIVYDEALYQQDLEYFEGILESFSVDAERVSEDSIVENFLTGRTLSAIIDTDSLKRLDGYGYALMKMPNLNETLTANSSSVTTLVIVNDFTEQEDAAADFAYFMTVTMADELHAASGHYSVIPSEDPDWVEGVALEAYTSAVPAPDSKDAKRFWVDLKETILKYF